ncbi:hypothetical protein ACRS10_12650 [Moraxella lacunata]
MKSCGQLSLMNQTLPIIRTAYTLPWHNSNTVNLLAQPSLVNPPKCVKRQIYLNINSPKHLAYPSIR